MKNKSRVQTWFNLNHFSEEQMPPFDTGKGGKEERGRTSKLTNLSFVSSVSCAQANGTWAFIQPRPNLFLELEPLSYGGQSARVQRRHPRPRGMLRKTG